MPQSVNVTARPRLPSRRLRSGPKTAAANAETSLVSVEAPHGYVDYITRLAFQGDATGSGYLEFRVYIGGVRACGESMTCTTQLGTIGSPEELNPPKEVSPGAVIEIRVFNSDTGNSYSAECDGVIDAYRDPL